LLSDFRGTYIKNKNQMPSIIAIAGDEANDFVETIKEKGKTNKEPEFVGFANFIGIVFPEEENEDNKDV